MSQRHYSVGWGWLVGWTSLSSIYSPVGTLKMIADGPFLCLDHDRLGQMLNKGMNRCVEIRRRRKLACHGLTWSKRSVAPNWRHRFLFWTRGKLACHDKNLKVFDELSLFPPSGRRFEVVFLGELYVPFHPGLLSKGYLPSSCLLNCSGNPKPYMVFSFENSSHFSKTWALFSVKLLLDTSYQFLSRYSQVNIKVEN